MILKNNLKEVRQKKGFTQEELGNSVDVSRQTIISIEGYRYKGEVPVMDKDGYAWMLHGDMGEDNTMAGVMTKEEAAPGQWIESGPHLMRMPADPSSLDGMTTDFNSGAPYVMFAGTTYAHVMYPMQDYFIYTKE